MSFNGSSNLNAKISILDIRSSKETSHTTRDTVAPIGYPICQGNVAYEIPSEFINMKLQYPMVNSPGFKNYIMQIPFEYTLRFDDQQDPRYLNGNYMNTYDYSKSLANKYLASNRSEIKVMEDNFERCQFIENNVQNIENTKDNTGYINVDNGVIYKDMLKQRQLNENKHAKKRIADLKQYPSNQTLGDSLEHVRRTKQLGLPQISAAAAWKKAGRPDNVPNNK